jgi:hypothetical protein
LLKNTSWIFRVSSSLAKLAPLTPPDFSNRPGINLDELIGSPGWILEDLLPPNRLKNIHVKNAEKDSISPETLRHLLRLSGLPPPRSDQEETELLSALHDQLHFVRHVQSVDTTNIKPLIRIGKEYESTDHAGTISYEECVEESKVDDIPGLEWTPWDVCSLNGGSSEGREHGWFIVDDEQQANEEDSGQ